MWLGQGGGSACEKWLSAGGGCPVPQGMHPPCQVCACTWLCTASLSGWVGTEVRVGVSANGFKDFLWEPANLFFSLFSHFFPSPLFSKGKPFKEKLQVTAWKH